MSSTAGSISAGIMQKPPSESAAARAQAPLAQALLAPASVAIVGQSDDPGKTAGRPLCEFQGLQWKFAEMAVKLDAAQLLLYRAVVDAQAGLPSPYETAAANLACNLAGWEVANESLQVMGGMGFSEETSVEYCVRRTRGWMIAGGSIEILKNRIAEEVFGRRFEQRPA